MGIIIKHQQDPVDHHILFRNQQLNIQSKIFKMDSQLYAKLTDAERKTQVACQQMLLLSDQLDSLKTRYEKAVNANFRCLRYPLRMKIVTVEGVINMYYQYTVEKQKEVEVLRYHVYGEEPVHDPFEEEFEDHMEQ